MDAFAILAFFLLVAALVYMALRGLELLHDCRDLLTRIAEGLERARPRAVHLELVPGPITEQTPTK